MSIKLSFFMTKYKMKKTYEERLQFVEEYIKNEYVPFETKADVAKAIVDTSYWRTEKTDGNKRKVLHVDSVANYMLKCMALVDLYTDIERQKNEGKMLEDFNTLNGSGILDMIIQSINPRELKEFNMVLQMTQDDVIANEFENHAFISQQIERFGQLIGTALSPVIEQLDFEQIEKVIDQFK